MFSPLIAFLYLSLSVVVTSTNAASHTTVYPASTTNTVHIRIEGQNTTIYEGPITSGPRNITLKDTFSPLGFPCDGLNDRANAKPGNTALDALDATSKALGFTYDGSFDGDLDDFYISRISTSDTVDTNNTWCLLVNYTVSTQPEGLTLTGCQTEVKPGDDVLWAYYNDITGIIPEDKYVFLKLVPTAVTVKKGKGFTVTVTDGRTGAAVKDASVDGVHTDANGKATLYLFDTGFFQFKAHQTGSVRSNVMNVTVTN